MAHGDQKGWEVVPGDCQSCRRLHGEVAQDRGGKELITAGKNDGATKKGERRTREEAGGEGDGGSRTTTVISLSMKPEKLADRWCSKALINVTTTHIQGTEPVLSIYMLLPICISTFFESFFFVAFSFGLVFAFVFIFPGGATTAATMKPEAVLDGE